MEHTATYNNNDLNLLMRNYLTKYKFPKTLTPAKYHNLPELSTLNNPYGDPNALSMRECS